MAKIFISHDHKDKNIVSSITEELGNYGHQIFNLENLSAGSSFTSVIKAQLSNSDVTIVLVTENSKESKWVTAEANVALGFVQERGKGAVIPVLFDEVELPQALRHLQAVIARRDNLAEVSEKINHAISILLGRQVAKDKKREEKQEKIEKTAEDFIRESQKELKGREKRNRLYAHIWYGVAYVALLFGLVASVWRASAISDGIKEWSSVAEVAIVGLLIIGLIIAISKFAFTLGKSYMVESLRNADRSHAISFGEFYLKAFGDNLDWTEVKEAFQHWNIDKGSSFLEQNTKDFDPNILERAVEIAKILTPNNVK